MDISLPAELQSYLKHLDNFIDSTIAPLQAQDDNERFFDYRREHARTDWDNRGLPRHEWSTLLRRATRLADDAGIYRFPLLKEYGGAGHPNTQLWMAVIREHLAAKGLGLFNDLQTEHSIVGNFPVVGMVRHFWTGGDERAKRDLIEKIVTGKVRPVFGLTEPAHGSDATWMETTAVEETRDGVKGYTINGSKAWQSGMNEATHVFLFARTKGKSGSAHGITCFMIPVTSPGVKIESYEWTFNMPTDHATVSYTSVFAPVTSILGTLHSGLAVAQSFVHENRIRQAASSLGAAVFCVRESVAYARARHTFGRPLADAQAIQFPLVELHTQCEMLRLLIRQTAAAMDNERDWRDVERTLGDRVAMCNYWANRLCCQAADRAIQVHGGVGYSRHKQFEHIYRHHRRYRITEGSEEIQMRKVAGYMFGFVGAQQRRERKGSSEKEEKDPVQVLTSVVKGNL